MVAALACGVTGVATLQLADAHGLNIDFRAFVPGLPAQPTGGYKTPFANWRDVGHNPVIGGQDMKAMVDAWWMDLPLGPDRALEGDARSERRPPVRQHDRAVGEPGRGRRQPQLERDALASRLQGRRPASHRPARGRGRPAVEHGAGRRCAGDGSPGSPLLICPCPSASAHSRRWASIARRLTSGQSPSRYSENLSVHCSCMLMPPAACASASARDAADVLTSRR